MTYWTTQLANFPTGPVFNQRTSPTWDGDSTPGGENGQLDCGPTCLSAQIYYDAGVFMPGDTIKDRIEGQGAKGPTSAAQLRAFALNQASIPTTLLTPNSATGTADGSLLNLLWQKTRDGYAVQELRWWDHANSGYLHWAICVGLDPASVFVFDPWVGTIIVESYQTHSQMYQGTAFSYDRLRDPNL